MKIYQNEALKRHIKEELCINPNWEERDFVSYAKKYFSGALHKIFVVGGLRGTGKTVGLLQSIKLKRSVLSLTNIVGLRIEKH